MKPWKEIGIVNFTMFVAGVPFILIVFVVLIPAISVMFVHELWKRYRDVVIKRAWLNEAHKRASRREA